MLRRRYWLPLRSKQGWIISPHPGFGFSMTSTCGCSEEEEALKVLDRISPREPSNPRVQLQRAKIYKLKRQLDLAEATLKKILGNPVRGAANYELAKILQQRKETTAAKTALLKAVQQEENNPEYLCELGQCVSGTGERR